MIAVFALFRLQVRYLILIMPMFTEADTKKNIWLVNVPYLRPGLKLRTGISAVRVRVIYLYRYKDSGLTNSE